MEPMGSLGIGVSTSSFFISTLKKEEGKMMSNVMIVVGVGMYSSIKLAGYFIDNGKVFKGYRLKRWIEHDLLPIWLITIALAIVEQLV